MSKELLRITMTEKQIREALTDAALDRALPYGPPATAVIEGIPADMTITVVFTKKRVRNSTKEKA